MSILEAIILGAVQGLTEFIPISSSGHLVIVPEVLGWEPPGLAFDVLLHAASLLALVAYFRRDLVLMVRGSLAGEPTSRRLAFLLVLGTIPAGLAGLLLGDYFEKSFEDARSAAVQLVITAALIAIAELVYRRHTSKREHMRQIEDLRIGDAIAVGIGQAVSILPGISRSGTTIGVGLVSAVEREAAARFAFLLAIPALAGAAALKLPELQEAALGAGAGVAGFVSSLVFSYVAIAGLIRYLKTRSLWPFAVYCLVVGTIGAFTL